MTLLAAAFLGFDGAALAGLGWWIHQPALTVIGCGLFVSSSWRRYQRQ